MEDIIKTVKSFEDSGLLLKGVSETIQNKSGQNGGFLSMLLSTLGSSLLGNMLAGKEINKTGEGFIRAGYGPKRYSFKDFVYCLILWLILKYKSINEPTKTHKIFETNSSFHVKKCRTEKV